MTSALTSLEFIEAGSVKIDMNSRQARFAVKSSLRSQFDLAAVQDAIKKKGYDDVKLLVGPTDS